MKAATLPFMGRLSSGARARGQQPLHVAGFGVACQDQDSGTGDLRAERLRCLQAIEAGHRNIHDQYIGPKLPHQPDRLGPVISFPDDFQVGLAVENHPQARAH